MQGFKRFVKVLLRDTNEENYVLYEKDRWLSNHDIAHIRLSKLPPINIGGNLITGIGGTCIPEFKTEKLEPQYENGYDECRVAFYQVIKNPTICGVARALYWAGWLGFQKKENPYWVFYQQYESMK